MLRIDLRRLVLPGLTAVAVAALTTPVVLAQRATTPELQARMAADDRARSAVRRSLATQGISPSDGVASATPVGPGPAAGAGVAGSPPVQTALPTNATTIPATTAAAGATSPSTAAPSSPGSATSVSMPAGPMPAAPMPAGSTSSASTSSASTAVPSTATTTITLDPAQVAAALSAGTSFDPATTVFLSASDSAPVPTDPTGAAASTTGAATSATGAATSATGAATVPTSTGGAGSSVPRTSGGWHSGASGDQAASGAFGTWRGKAIQAAAVWGDTSAAEQTAISALDAYSWFDGDMDVAVGALAPGDTWAQAAAGAYAERWRQAIRSVKARRAGKAGTTYIRFAHEMNGDWFDWKVTSGNVDAFHTAWRLYASLLRQEYPEARLVFSPNNGNHSDVPISQIYPGDDVVDVVGVDLYDGWPAINTASDWSAYVNTTEQNGQPYAAGSWLAFAAQHGKPMSFPEWGLRDGDRPAFIQGMHDFMAANAAQPGASAAGKIVYDVYFDIANGGNANFMITGSSNPQAAALYRSLTWGV